jgi:thiosulfate dehydrogenase (quinone) large subunit
MSAIQQRPPQREVSAVTGDRVSTGIAPVVWAITRISIGFVFLWAFLDKTFGLRFATPTERAWLNGGSPTKGYLAGVEGPFAGLFNPMSGAPWADWLFMVGLLGIGTALILGIGMRIAAVTGALLLVFMWMASLPLENNPFMDDHLVYAMVLVGLAAMDAGDFFGLGTAWARLPLVQKYPALR